MDPKTFYDTVMPSKHGADYEAARWKAEPLRAAQYSMATQALARLIMPVRSAGRVLEVGPGPGTWTKLLLAQNPTADYVLVDISHEMLAQARTSLASHANVSFVESDFLAYAPGESFDFFFSSRAIEYMPDKEAVCRKVAALLSPGGTGVIVTKMPKPFFDRMRKRGVSALHTGQIGPTALTQALADSGLTVTSVRLVTATVPGLHSAFLNQVAFSMLSWLPFISPLFLFAESYAVAFQKP